MSKRIIYIDIIKVIAFLMVIFNHCDFILLNKSITLFNIHSVMFYFSKAAVPLFFMISGILLMNKNDSKIKIFKRIIRLLLPLIGITILWSIFKSGYIDFKKMINPDYNNFFAYWLWFLIPMIIIYILLPIIRKIVINFENSNLFKVIIIIILVFTSILFTIFDFTIKKNFLFITNVMPMPILYFIYGYLLSKEKNNKKLFFASFILIFINVLIPSLIAFYMKTHSIPYFVLDDYKNIFTFFISSSIFIIVKYLFGNVKWDNSFTKTMNHLANNSYGIYLFHVFIIELLIKTTFMVELIDLSRLESVFVMIALVIIILDIPIYILKKIPIINDYL